jgi:SAM-dependent methyltransferase
MLALALRLPHDAAGGSREGATMRMRRDSPAHGERSRHDHHDWASETYVEEWVRRQQAEDLSRAGRFQLICDLLPFPRDATVKILDVGAGYGPVSRFILDRYPRATCVVQDGSEPMLNRARSLVEKYGGRVKLHRSDLFDARWLPEQFGPFDAAVSSSCLHNLRDFTRIRQIYREIHAHLTPGGALLNADLINAPTAALHQRYDAVAEASRRRDGASAQDLAAMVRHRRRPTTTATRGPFPATLDQHLAALRAVGFTDVDCFWKELRRAVFGGFASKLKARRSRSRAERGHGGTSWRGSSTSR